ncbi:tonB-system energizer ExbB [Rhizobium rhizosphaerae]|uniref:Biopolymer transport protein ExbB n=1 Tax=Xaviernesmea rhizosphaerae TaxID=1672749 RepID=A0ABX3PIR2_9HYPH|nr:tonB-system energizer ExbB [Xaviernesmea rhizosphaerae]OQP88030.1 tonB-system energizer ExbB [Xaviernesmea rhizosphaerae]
MVFSISNRLVRTATAAAIGLMLAAGPAVVCAQTQSPSSAPGLVEGQAAPAPAAPAAQPDALAPDLSAQEGATPSAQSLDAQGEVQARDPALPHDLSPLGMFLAADWVVKGVMIGLALASVASWAILVAKTAEIAAAKRRARKALARLAAARGLSDLADGAGLAGPGAQMVAEAREELTRSETVIDLVPSAGLRERVASRLARVEAGAGKRAAAGTGILATIGSIAPFVGLFGTVWGIMNSFIGISQSQTTNLAVVAPGIAEALLATAIGLVAAIPAVVIYNYFARSISGYKAILADLTASVERLVSRDLDQRLARRLSAERPLGERGLSSARGN